MAAGINNVGCLEEEALKRRERLKSLKRKAETEESTSANVNNQDHITLPKYDFVYHNLTFGILLLNSFSPRPKFRSYKPQDEGLKESVLPDAKPGDIETEVKDQLDAAKSKVVIEELDITNLAPRKPDWDLKRDVAKKLERLERRTQKAIAELIRDRLKQRQDDLATLVNMAPTE